MEKNYYMTDGIGKAKYTVSSHDGEKTHPDQSPFYDIAIFRSKKARNAFVGALKKEGYVPRSDFKAPALQSSEKRN